jgi:hypothetical protein
MLRLRELTVWLCPMLVEVLCEVGKNQTSCSYIARHSIIDHHNSQSVCHTCLTCATHVLHVPLYGALMVYAPFVLPLLKVCCTRVLLFIRCHCKNEEESMHTTEYTAKQCRVVI